MFMCLGGVGVGVGGGGHMALVGRQGSGMRCVLVPITGGGPA